MRMFLLFAVITGCSQTPPRDARLVAGFDPPAAPAGYTRYVAPAYVGLKPGEDAYLCQWVANAVDGELDIVDVTGHQSMTGHHATLYATTDTSQPVGTSRPCTNADMLTVEFLGAVGGEGVSSNVTKLPPNIVFRLHKGRALMVNSHYLNASSEMVNVQSVIDVRYTPPTPEHRVAGLTGINVGDFKVPPHAAIVRDGYCKWEQDASLIMFSNHLHKHGTSIFTEVKRADGSVTPLSSDLRWSLERTFNPRWDRWNVERPMVIKAGDEVHVHCEWQNDTDNALLFPDEMCVGLGFYLESGEQRVCNGVVR